MNVSDRRPLRVTRAGVLASVGVLVVAAICVRLGFWQLDRLGQRRLRNDALVQRTRLPALTATQLTRDTTGLFYRTVRVAGAFDDTRTFALANRSLRGLPGVYVYTPLRLAGSTHAVLVNRGWAPAPDAATVNFDSLRPPPTAEISAVVLPLPASRSKRTAARGFRHTWFQLDTATLQAQLPYALLPYQLQAVPTGGARAFPVALALPRLDQGPHLGYAIQWFSFAAIATIGWLALVVRRSLTKNRGGRFDLPPA